MPPTSSQISSALCASSFYCSYILLVHTVCKYVLHAYSLYTQYVNSYYMLTAYLFNER